MLKKDMQLGPVAVTCSIDQVAFKVCSMVFEHVLSFFR